jgi:Holliday junction resolvase RusA-like endonuclease
MTPLARSLKNSYILQAIHQYKGSPLHSNLSVYIRLYFPDKRVRDWDNWHKLSMDSLTGIVWIDDNQVKLATVQIMDVDKKDPRIEIIIENL